MNERAIAITLPYGVQLKQRACFRRTGFGGALSEQFRLMAENKESKTKKCRVMV
jgi:hypothetical protein